MSVNRPGKIKRVVIELEVLTNVPSILLGTRYTSTFHSYVTWKLQLNANQAEVGEVR